MRLALVRGTVTATAKDSQLGGQKLLIVDYVNGTREVLEAGHVILDACGAGLGDEVVVASGSAARLPERTRGAPTDATAVAIVESKSIAGSWGETTVYNSDGAKVSENGPVAGDPAAG